MNIIGQWQFAKNAQEPAEGHLPLPFKALRTIPWVVQAGSKYVFITVLLHFNEAAKGSCHQLLNPPPPNKKMARQLYESIELRKKWVEVVVSATDKKAINGILYQTKMSSLSWIYSVIQQYCV